MAEFAADIAAESEKIVVSLLALHRPERNVI